MGVRHANGYKINGIIGINSCAKHYRSSRPDGKHEWRPEYGFSYGKDYAIFARLKLLKDPKDPMSEYYFHYFIAGIRGLGTWGLGYLIDHDSSKLSRFVKDQEKKYESEDVQLLLEVTYDSFRVTEVKDVSEEDTDYFRSRGADKYIDHQLEEYRDWLPKPHTTVEPTPSSKT